MTFRILVLLSILSFAPSAFTYDNQPSEMKLMAHIGKVATATLDEIDLSQLMHAPATNGGFEYYTSQSQQFFFTVGTAKYRLVQMKRAGVKDPWQLDFVEDETGTSLSMRDNSPVVNIFVLGGSIKAKVTAPAK